MISLARWRVNFCVATPIEYGLTCPDSIGMLACWKVSPLSFLPAIQSFGNEKKFTIRLLFYETDDVKSKYLNQRVPR